MVALLSAAALPARAESDANKAKARARMADGVKLLDRKDYAAALAAFEEAYALVPSAKIQFNIGVAKRGLGRRAEALEAFDQFLELAPYAPPASRAEAEKARDDLRQQVAFFKVNVDQTGAAVTIDGRAAGTSPLHKLVPVEVGSHEITAQLEGTTRRQTVTAPVAGQTTVVWFQLVEDKRPAAETTPPPQRAVEAEAAAPRAARAPDASPPPSLREEPREAVREPARDTPGDRRLSPPASAPRASGRSGWRIVAPVVAGSATLLAGGAGLMALVLRNNKAASYNDCIKMTPNACDDLHNQTTQWQQWEAAAFVAAGVLAVTTITLAIVTSGDSPADPASVAFGCAPVLTAPGLTCSARF